MNTVPKTEDDYLRRLNFKDLDVKEPVMVTGNRYTPIYDRLHGVFCWLRHSDQEVTMWDTGVEAEQMRLVCSSSDMTPERVDQLAKEEFERQEI